MSEIGFPSDPNVFSSQNTSELSQSGSMPSASTISSSSSSEEPKMNVVRGVPIGRAAHSGINLNTSFDFMIDDTQKALYNRSSSPGIEIGIEVGNIEISDKQTRKILHKICKSIVKDLQDDDKRKYNIEKIAVELSLNYFEKGNKIDYEGFRAHLQKFHDLATEFSENEKTPYRELYWGYNSSRLDILDCSKESPTLNLGMFRCVNSRDWPIIMLPLEIGKLTHLKQLLIECQPLVELPVNFKNLKKLTKLCLSSCNFEKIPEILFELPELKILSLSNNPLKNISSVSKLTNLEIFSVTVTREKYRKLNLADKRKMRLISRKMNSLKIHDYLTGMTPLRSDKLKKFFGYAKKCNPNAPSLFQRTSLGNVNEF